MFPPAVFGQKLVCESLKTCYTKAIQKFPIYDLNKIFTLFGEVQRDKRRAKIQRIGSD
jgi:hypothetical protein